jgi:hypothetical protein
MGSLPACEETKPVNKRCSFRAQQAGRRTWGGLNLLGDAEICCYRYGLNFLGTFGENQDPCRLCGFSRAGRL